MLLVCTYVYTQTAPCQPEALMPTAEAVTHATILRRAVLGHPATGSAAYLESDKYISHLLLCEGISQPLEAGSDSCLPTEFACTKAAVRQKQSPLHETLLHLYNLALKMMALGRCRHNKSLKGLSF